MAAPDGAVATIGWLTIAVRRQEVAIMLMRSLIGGFGLLVALSSPAVGTVVDDGPTRVHVQNGVMFRSGGIGMPERLLLARAAADFNLKLVFAEGPHRAYLSDVRVVIERPGGAPLVDAVSEGPWFFVRLEPGEYVVRIRYGSGVKEQRITVGDRQRDVTFLW